ncbi:MAG TPA: site-2 protease family protein [Demequinaceae bacterium]
MNHALLTTAGVLILALGVMLSIGLHEIGHMVPAKLFGVRVSQYMVGFGPTLWSRTRGETEYGIKAIPAGGYVRLTGMIPPADEVRPVKGTGWAARAIEDARLGSVEEILPGQEHRAFYRLSWGRKVIVMAGGPVVNLVIALVIFTASASIHGVFVAQPVVGTVVDCVPAVDAAGVCAAGDPPSAASQAGLRAGDVIVSSDGVAVKDWASLSADIRAHGGVPMTLGIDRGGQSLTLTVTPTAADVAAYGSNGLVLHNADGSIATKHVGFLGMSPTQVIVRQNLAYGTTEMFSYLGSTAGMMVRLPALVYHAGRTALGLEARDPGGLVSVVGVGRIGGEIASSDVTGYTFGDRVADMFGLVAALNLALFAFNMIPLLPLDGGHIASALWQGVKNGWARVRALPMPRPVDVARMMPIAYAVFVLLMGMGLLLMYVDFVDPVKI